MKFILVLFVIIISFNVNSEEQRHAKTFAKCAFLSSALELNENSIIFHDAYLALKGIAETDVQFDQQMFFTEGLVSGYALAKKQDNSSVTREFYYSVCKDNIFKYAKDLAIKLKANNYNVGK